MSDAMTALATVTLLPPQGMVTLRADLGDATVRAAIETATGHAVPDTRSITGTGEAGLGWMSPDELMVFTDREAAPALAGSLAEALAGQHHLALDVSDARAVFLVEGPGVREVIAKLCPVDMAPGVFGPGELRRTRLAQVAAAFWMESETRLRLVCFRSVARYAEDVLTNAARPGTAVGLF